MKKFFSLCLVLVALFMLNSCDSSQKPEDALKQTVESVKNGDSEAFVKCLNPDAPFVKALQEGDSASISRLDKGMAACFENYGGVKDVKINNVNTSDDGNTATIDFVIIMNDGTQQPDSQQFVKKNGRWYMDF